MGPTMPLEIAQCARDKLQASARELWSSIRSFDEGARKEDGGSPHSTEHSASVSLEKIENVFKVMFGSCTSGAIPSPEAEPANIKPFEARSRSTRSRDFISGEHVYAQLFVDDQTRAARAVDGLREKAASSPPSKSPSRQFPTSNPTGFAAGNNVPAAPPTTKAVDVSGDFDFDDGISAISQNTLEEMARTHDYKAKCYSKNIFTANRISPAETISYPRKNRSHRVQASTKPTLAPTPTTPGTTTCTTTTPTTEALKFTRGRSTGTLGSKGTKSTRSSQDSEFASVWRREEQKYWTDVVQQDKKVDKNTFIKNKSPKQAFPKKARRRSRCGSASTKQDVTIATVSSSSYSNFSSQFDKHHHHFHPHNVIQFDNFVAIPDIFHRELPITSLDSNRIQKCMVVPFGSELGEI